MKLSSNTNKIEPSKGRRLFNLASQYNNVINLTLGDPDTITPLCIREAACQSIMSGNTHYSANAGLLDLRETYSEYLNKTYQKKFDPKTQIIATVGGMEALYLSLLCTVEKGDEVIIFAPYYINYYQMVVMCGATPIVIDTKEDNYFIPEIQKISEKISSSTKAIIINSPNNPTGAVYDEKTIKEIINLARTHDLLVISDEVYKDIVFKEEKHYSVLNLNEDYENIVLIDSCSKSYSMTGWRIGFAVGSEMIISAMTKFQENIAACAPLPSQYAAIEAYKNPPNMNGYVKDLEERCNFLFEKINSIPLLSCLKPHGTFYLFVNIEEVGMSSMDFAIELLEEVQVALVPGIAYGDGFDNYVRIACTLEKTKLEEAAILIEKYITRRCNRKE